MNEFLLSLLVTIQSAFSPQVAFAQTSDACPVIYNGGAVCQQAKDFAVDKKVQTPKDGSYVDTIPENETKVQPERTMIFRITVSNKTEKTLRNVMVTDTLPSFVNFVKADGKVRQNSQRLTYTISSLEAKKSAVMNIEAKIASAATLPNSSPICVANQAEATSGVLNKQTAKDFVTFCIERPGAPSAPTPPTNQPTFPGQTKGGIVAPTATPLPTQPATTKGGQPVYPSPNTTSNPNTGPEVLALIGLLPAGAGGFFLRKLSRQQDRR